MVQPQSIQRNLVTDTISISIKLIFKKLPDGQRGHWKNSKMNWWPLTLLIINYHDLGVWLWMGYGLVNGFNDHLELQVITVLSLSPHYTNRHGTR
jgi:hypothetical protein